MKRVAAASSSASGVAAWSCEHVPLHSSCRGVLCVRVAFAGLTNVPMDLTMSAARTEFEAIAFSAVKDLLNKTGEAADGNTRAAAAAAAATRRQRSRIGRLLAVPEGSPGGGHGGSSPKFAAPSSWRATSPQHGWLMGTLPAAWLLAHPAAVRTGSLQASSLARLASSSPTAACSTQRPA